MLRISYRDTDRRAVLAWDADDANAPWLSILTRLIFDNCDNVSQDGARLITVPWWSFSAIRPRLLQIFSGFQLKLGTAVDVSSQAAELLRRATATAFRYEAAAKSAPLPEAQLLARLSVLLG